MNKVLRNMLENAGTVRHVCNMLLITGIRGITNEERKQIHYNCTYKVWGSGKKQEIVIEIPNWYWGEDGGLIIEAADEEVVVPKKVFRRLLADPLGYLESINQHIRRFCWQNTQLTTTPQHTPELAISDWQKYFLSNNCSVTGTMELYDNWIDNGKLVLIDGEDYRREFWDRYADCFSDDILPLMGD